MVNLNISPEAKDDLTAIKAYITHELKNQQAAINLVSRILKMIRSLPEQPGIGTPLSCAGDVHTDYRFLICSN